MTAVGSKQLYRRLDPFAQKHKIWVGLHNEPDSLRTMADFDEVLQGMSPYMRMTLDVGHFVAGGSDPVDCLNGRHDKILNLHIKDRKKSKGPNMMFGEGDTPIKEVLKMDRDRKYRIPAHIEYEIASDHRVDDVRRCFEYCKKALTS
jgi:sugar phosphate isomerase/epimerase